MNYSEDSAIPTASREPEIRRALVKLRVSIEENEKVIINLSERLKPVSRQLLTKSSSDGRAEIEKESDCEIAREIGDYAELIKTITRRVNEMTGLLEI